MKIIKWILAWPFWIMMCVGLIGAYAILRKKNQSEWAWFCAEVHLDGKPDLLQSPTEH